MLDMFLNFMYKTFFAILFLPFLKLYLYDFIFLIHFSIWYIQDVLKVALPRLYSHCREAVLYLQPATSRN